MTQTRLRNQPLLTPDELAARLDEFRRAVEEYNAGYWFESHETLEDLWMVTPLPERQFFQGVIQLAAAFVHYARGEHAGILKLLDAAGEKLREFVPEFLGVDVVTLLADIGRARDEIAALHADQLDAWDAAHVPAIHMIDGDTRGG
jgi:predicted metal-dependent hydrolase